MQQEDIDIVATPHPTHRFEDESHHGTPIWICRWCEAGKYEEAGEQPCPQYEVMMEKERLETERQERLEYEQMKRQRERWAYLHEKYGPHPDQE